MDQHLSWQHAGQAICLLREFCWPLEQTLRRKMQQCVFLSRSRHPHFIVHLFHCTFPFEMQHGWNSLITAAARGHYDVVSFLLERGANPLALDKYQADAICYARQNGHTRIVRLLKRATQPPIGLGCECYDSAGDSGEDSGTCQDGRNECVIS